MSLLHISEHEFVTPAGILRIPPLRSHSVELQQDETAKAIICHPAAQVLRVFAEEDCTLVFSTGEVRLAAGVVELLALPQMANLQLAVKASD